MVVRGYEVLADGEHEGEGAACLDLVGVVDKAGEQGTQECLDADRVRATGSECVLRYICNRIHREGGMNPPEASATRVDVGARVHGEFPA